MICAAYAGKRLSYDQSHRREMPGKMRTRFDKKTQEAGEQSFDNNREAHILLDLIDAEFRSDPSSTQCFDLRIVERVRKCVEDRKRIRNNLPFDFD